MFASGSQIEAPAHPADTDLEGQYRARCWNSPEALEPGFFAAGFPLDSQAMIRIARSTWSAAK